MSQQELDLTLVGHLELLACLIPHEVLHGQHEMPSSRNAARLGQPLTFCFSQCSLAAASWAARVARISSALMPSLRVAALATASARTGETAGASGAASFTSSGAACRTCTPSVRIDNQ